MLIPHLELTILQSIVNDETFTRKVLPYVKDVYFETPASRTLFQLCSEHFVRYGSIPTAESLAIGVEQLEGRTEEEFRSIVEGEIKNSGDNANIVQMPE